MIAPPNPVEYFNTVDLVSFGIFINKRRSRKVISTVSLFIQQHYHHNQQVVTFCEFENSPARNISAIGPSIVISIDDLIRCLFLKFCQKFVVQMKSETPQCN